MDHLTPAALNNLSILLAQSPEKLTRVHDDVWTLQLPQTAIAVACSDGGQEANQAVSLLVRRLNLLGHSKSAFSQNLFVFLIGRICPASQDNLLSSSLPTWFQSTMSILLRYNDDSILANTLMSLSELIQLGRSNPELRKCIQPCIGRLLDIILKSISTREKVLKEYFTLLSSIAINQPQLMLAKRDLLVHSCLKLLLHPSSIQDVPMIKVICTSLRSLFCTTDRHRFQHVEFSAICSKLLATLSYILDLFCLPSSNAVLMDGSDTASKTYISVLFDDLSANSTVEQLPLLSVFQKIALVIRHLVSDYEPNRPFELDIKEFFTIIDKTYSTIEKYQSNKLLNLSAESCAVLAKTTNQLLLIAMTLARNSECSNLINELCRKALVLSHGEGRISAYQVTKQFFLIGTPTDLLVQLFIRMIIQDIQNWKKNMVIVSDQMSRKRKIGSTSLVTQGSNIDFRIDAKVLETGLQAAVSSRSVMHDSSVLIEALIAWLYYGALDQVHESQHQSALVVQTQLILTIGAMISGGSTSSIHSTLPLILKMIIKCIHHPEPQICEASLTVINNLTKLIHPIIPPLAMRSTVASASTPAYAFSLDKTHLSKNVDVLVDDNLSLNQPSPWTTPLQPDRMNSAQDQASPVGLTESMESEMPTTQKVIWDSPLDYPPNRSVNSMEMHALATTFDSSNVGHSFPASPLCTMTISDEMVTASDITTSIELNGNESAPIDITFQDNTVASSAECDQDDSDSESFPLINVDDDE
ncbi:hypothetical protein MT418_002105 [Batrachochytrium dendrobatidis]